MAGLNYCPYCHSPITDTEPCVCGLSLGIPITPLEAWSLALNIMDAAEAARKEQHPICNYDGCKSEMTHKDRLVELLKDFGVGFKDTSNPVWRSDDYDPKICGSSILCEKGMDLVGGYNGFCAEFVFDSSGKFIVVNLWE